MATAQTSGFETSIVSGADLSAKQYYFVMADGTLAGNGEAAIGTISDPGSASGDVITVQILGIAKMSQAESITVGAEVGVDANGQAVAAASGDAVVGVCIENGGAANAIGTLLLHAGAEKN